MPNLGNPHIRRATIMASYSRLVKMVIISLAFIALSSYVSTIACGTLGDQSLGATRSRSKVGLLPIPTKTRTATADLDSATLYSIPIL